MVADTKSTPEAADEDTPPRKRGWLLPLVLSLTLGGAGFASTYFGLWSPLDMISAPAADKDHAPETAFVDVPTAEVPLPGTGRHVVTISATIETSVDHVKEIEHEMPRLQDAFNEFLSNIDPGAFEKRGVLEIIRAELQTRARQILGQETVHDLLIKEFRLK